MYQEEADSTFTHNGKTYVLNDMLRRAKSLPVKDVPVMWIAWCASEDKSKSDRERTDRADLDAPILYTVDPVYGHVVLDGAHRTAKAVKQNKKTLPGREIPKSWL